MLTFGPPPLPHQWVFFLVQSRHIEFVFFQQKQIQIFRQQIQRREYHISRIIETKYPEFALPEDKLKVLVTKWEIVKQKVTVLEERIWEVGRHVRKDGKLGNLLLWLHEAEALLNYYETDESWVCEVPAKFLLRQHEVSVSFVYKARFRVRKDSGQVFL